MNQKTTITRISAITITVFLLSSCSGKINNNTNWVPCINKFCKKESKSPKRIKGNLKDCSALATVAEVMARKRARGIDIRSTKEYKEFSKIQYRQMNIGEELAIAVEQTSFMKPNTLSAAITYSCSVPEKSVAAHEMRRRFGFYKKCNQYDYSYEKSLKCIIQADKDRIFN